MLYPSTDCHRNKCDFPRFLTYCGLKLKHNIEHVNSQNDKHFNEVIIYHVQSKSPEFHLKHRRHVSRGGRRLILVFA